MQWADTDSLDLLFHLGRHLKGNRILIIGVYRASEVNPVSNGSLSPPTSVVLALIRPNGNRHVNLRQADGRQFVNTFLDAKPNRLNAAFRERLFQCTGGNVLFTAELWDSLKRRNAIVQDEEGIWIEGATPDWNHIPERIEAAIAERIAGLSPECQMILRVASVEGKTFTAEAIAKVLNMNLRNVVNALSETLYQQQRLVQPGSVQALGEIRLSRYEFRYDLLQRISMTVWMK